MKIEQLGPPHADHSTGLILRWRDRLLFAVEPRDHWQEEAGVQLACFVGIGGHVEPGETWEEAVRREAREEASLEVALAAPQVTYLFLGGGAVQDISTTLDWPGPTRPVLIWSAIHRFGRPPHEHARHFVVAAFCATVPDSACPRPVAEVPAILTVSEAQLRRAAAAPTSLRDLLADGSTIWESEPVSRSTRLAPSGSARWYAALLSHLEAIGGA